MIKIYHIIDKTFNGGAYSQLRYLYNTFNDYYSDKISQNIFLLDNIKKNKIDKKFDLPFKIITFRDLQSIKYEESSIFLYHKLMCSPCCSTVSFLKSLKVPVIVLSHTFSINKRLMTIGNPNACISVSNHMNKYIIKGSSNSTLFKVIHNWCDAVFVNTVPVIKYEKNNKEFLFGRVNGFNDIKYNKHFMKWFLNADFGLPARLQYIGSGHKMQHAKDLLLKNKDSSRNKIELLGQVNSDSDKFSLIKSWDAFLYNINLPEGTSMSVVESLVCGTPVICDLPGNTELIENNCNGYIYSSFTDAENFIRNTGLNGLENLKNSTIEHSNKYSAKSWGQKYIDVFHEVIDACNQSSSLRKNITVRNVSGTKNVSNKTKNVSNVIITNVKLDKNKTESQKSRSPFGTIKVKSPIKTNKFNFPIRNTSKVHVKKNPRVVTRLNNNEKISKIINYDFSDNQKFSILTAAFNNDKYLDYYFEHILMQKYRPLEVVFVDDRSTDNTKKIVEKWAQKLAADGIELVYKLMEKKGYCGNSYNKAMELSSGSICGIVDSDDALEPNAVSIMVNEYIKNPSALYIWSQFKICDNDMNFKRIGFSSHPSCNRSLLLSEFIGRKRHCFSHWRTFRKTKDIPFDLFGTNLKNSVDKYMGYRLEETGIGHFFNEPLYLYRSGVKTGLTHTSSQREVWSRIRRETQRRRMVSKIITHGFC